MLPIYCISLQRVRTERYIKTKNNYFIPLKLNVIEWKATDGNNYGTSKKLAYNNNIKLTKMGKELNKSLIATAISHRSIWFEMLKKDIEVATILEDDVTLHKEFKDKIKDIWNLIKNDPNINFLLLSYSDNDFINNKESKYNDLVNKLENFNGLFCYLVKKKGATELLEATNNLSYQIDIQISKNNKIFYCLKNKIAGYDDAIITTIHNHRCKLIEHYLGLNILNQKITSPFDFWAISIHTFFMMFLGIIFSLKKYNSLLINFINFVIFYIDLKIIGSRLDDFDFKIEGIIKDIGYYDSDEIVNKFYDHLLFSIIFSFIRFLI